MDQQQLPTSAEQTARTLNIIQFAMIMGVVSASAVLLGTDALKGVMNPKFIIDPIIMALAITGLAGSQIMPQILRSVPPDQEISDSELYVKFQTSIIVKYALLEGPAFAALILNRDKSLFGIMVLLVMIVALAVSVVTAGQINDYVKQVRELQEFQD